jgi:hypothetical protein
VKKSKRSIFFNLMPIFFITLSFILLVFVYYRSEFRDAGNLDYSKYYYLSIVSAFFWLIVSRLKYELKENILILSISIISSLYLIEIVLHLNSPRNYDYKREILAHNANIVFDTRSKFQVYRDLKEEGIDAIPSVQPSSFIGNNDIMPLGGVANKTTVFCNESGEMSIFMSDRYGFNNPDEQWDNNIELVILGDSFAQGACVNSGQDIASILRNETGASIINLGSEGNGPLIELATLKEYGELLKPESVIWMYYEGNDLDGNLENELSSDLLRKYLNQKFSQNLVDKQSTLDIMINNQVKKNESKVLLERDRNISNWSSRWFRLYNIRSLLNLDDYVESELKITSDFKNVLDTANLSVQEWGGKLYFVYLPSFNRYYSEIENHDEYRKKAEVISIVNELHIPVFDVHSEVFMKRLDPLSLFPFKIQGHYTAEAYAIIAKLISSKLALK